MTGRSCFARWTVLVLLAGAVGPAAAEPGGVGAVTVASFVADRASVEPIETLAPRRRQRLGIDPRPERTPAERAAYLRQVREWYEAPREQWPAPTLDDGVAHHELGPLPEMQHPADNPPSDAKRELGRLLFFDPRISGSGQIACASCHDPDLGWADGRTVSFGHNRRPLGRNSPSVLNSGFRRTMFWDGRAASLEEQAQAVLANPDEMHSGDSIFVDRLVTIPEYVERFSAVFGVEVPTIDEVAKALACYERSLVGTPSRFDRFVAGRHAALSDEAVSGLHLFRTDARCINCHSGPLLSDDEFHNLGLTHYGRPFQDLGRYAVTGEPEDVGRFRTPSLRDVTHTSPYMHNGLFDLDEVLRLYNAGMPNERRRRSQVNDALFPVKSPRLKPLGLNDRDLADLTAFLEGLSESRRRVRAPRLPAGL